MIDYAARRYMDHMIDDCVIYKELEGNQFSVQLREGDWNVFDYRDGKTIEREDAPVYFIDQIKLCLAVCNFCARIKNFHQSYQNWESLYMGLCYCIGFFCYAFSSYLF